MRPDVIKALKESTRRWRRRALGTYTGREGIAGCPLCQMFNTFETDDKQRCKGCPVFEVTGQTGCRGTPYMGWYRHQYSDRGLATAYAEMEANFLNALLPEEHRLSPLKVKQS